MAHKEIRFNEEARRSLQRGCRAKARPERIVGVRAIDPGFEPRRPSAQQRPCGVGHRHAVHRAGQPACGTELEGDPPSGMRFLIRHQVRPTQEIGKREGACTP